LKRAWTPTNLPTASSRGLLLRQLGFPVTDEVSLYQDAARSELLCDDMAFNALDTDPLYFTVHTGVTAALTTPLAPRTNVTPGASLTYAKPRGKAAATASVSVVPVSERLLAREEQKTLKDSIVELQKPKRTSELNTIIHCAPLTRHRPRRCRGAVRPATVVEGSWSDRRRWRRLHP
jgi:hypothetical protein